MNRPNSEINILVVDDEKEICETLADNLILEDFKVFTACCGNEAINIVKENIIDFVISDVRMPNGSGPELLDQIKLINPKLPHVVLITGFAEVTKEQIIERGGVDLITKPPNIDYIIDLIHKYTKNLNSIN